MPETIGVKIELVGEASTIAEIKKIDGQIKKLSGTHKNLKAELAKVQKALNAAYSSGDTAEIDKLTQAETELTQEISEQDLALKQLRAEKAKLNALNRQEIKAIKSVEGSYEALSAEIAIATKRLKAMKVGVNATEQEFSELEAKIKKGRIQLADFDRNLSASSTLVGEYERGVQGVVNKFLNGLNPAWGKGTKAANNFNQTINKTQNNVTQLNQSVTTSTTTIHNFSRGVGGATRNLLALAGGGFLAYNAFQSLILTTSSFSQTMAEVKAVSGATDDEFKQLSADAKELGESTKFTASQVGQLQLAYSKLGFTTGEILAATEATTQLSVATGEDLAESAEVAGSTLRAFGLEATETQRVVDVMASAFTSSALNMATFRDSAKFVAPVAKSAGISIERMTADLSALADAGIKGSNAGTALRRIYTEMAKSGKPVSQAFSDLAKNGISLADAHDEVGRTASSALLVLSENTEKVNKLTDAYGNAGGAAAKMAAIVEDNLQGDIDKLKSAFESLFITVGEDGSGVLRTLIQVFTGTIKVIRDNKEVIIGAVAAYGALKAAVLLGKIAKEQYNIAAKAATVQTALSTKVIMGQVVASKQAAVSTGIFTKSLRGLNAVLKQNMVGVLVGGFTAMLALWPKSAKAIGQVEAAQNDLNAAFGEEIAKVDTLFREMKKENTTRERRAELIDKINTQYGDYLPNLLTEQSTAEEIEAAYRAINEQLRIKVANQIKEEKSVEIIKKQYQALEDAREAAKEIDDLIKSQKGGALTGNIEDVSLDDMNDYIDLVKELSTQQQNGTGATREQVIELGRLEAKMSKLKDVFVIASAGGDLFNFKEMLSELNQALVDINQSAQDFIGQQTITGGESGGGELGDGVAAVNAEAQKTATTFEDAFNMVNGLSEFTRENVTEALRLIDEALETTIIGSESEQRLLELKARLQSTVESLRTDFEPIDIIGIDKINTEEGQEELRLKGQAAGKAFGEGLRETASEHTESFLDSPVENFEKLKDVTGEMSNAFHDMAASAREGSKQQNILTKASAKLQQASAAATKAAALASAFQGLGQAIAQPFPLNVAAVASTLALIGSTFVAFKDLASKAPSFHSGGALVATANGNVPANGGKITGASNDGIRALYRGTPVNVEGGETYVKGYGKYDYIVSKPPGGVSPYHNLLSAINVAHGGADFAGTGTKPLESFNNGFGVPSFSTGAAIPRFTPSTNTTAGGDNAKLAQMIVLLDAKIDATQLVAEAINNRIDRIEVINDPVKATSAIQKQITFDNQRTF